MRRTVTLLRHARVTSLFLAGLLGMVPPANAQTQLQIYGAWHCYTDGCSWASVPNMATFDTDNRWLIDRDMNGTYMPSVNLVILSFVDPVKRMNLTTDSGDVNGIPIGMNRAVINYVQSRGVRVMMSIGGASNRKNWDEALSNNPTKLGINAANAAKQFNVGMEIDYENSSSPNLSGLQSFVAACRSQIPYDATGANDAARLTIDLGNDDLYQTKLAAYAVTNWLQTSAPVLDYANAMVSSQKTNVATLETGWQQHVDGVSGFGVAAGASQVDGKLVVDLVANRIATTSATPIRIQPPVLSKISRRRVRERPRACWGIGSGRLGAKGRGRAARFRRTLARTEWEERRGRSTFRFRCRHYDRISSGESDIRCVVPDTFVRGCVCARRVRRGCSLRFAGRTNASVPTCSTRPEPAEGSRG